MKVLFFDVGYTLVNEDAVWEARCREQAQTAEAKKLGLSATDIYHEIEIASVSRKPQFRTLIDKYNFKEVAPYRTELEKLYDEAHTVIKRLSQKYELGIIANTSSQGTRTLKALTSPFLGFVINPKSTRRLKRATAIL
ncbi:MAG: hypothetical protein K6D95_00410 [Treponema sp.]|nr:hypothetical protein [Treponema sp.]